MSEQSHPYGQAKIHANQLSVIHCDNPNLSFEIHPFTFGVMGNHYHKTGLSQLACNFFLKIKLPQSIIWKCLYNNNVYFAVVDVADVSEAIYKAAITKIFMEKLFIVKRNYRVSDVTLMLNNQPPIGKPKYFIATS